MIYTYIPIYLYTYILNYSIFFIYIKYKDGESLVDLAINYGKELSICKTGDPVIVIMGSNQIHQNDVLTFKLAKWIKYNLIFNF